jgi:hypothetical protein
MALIRADRVKESTIVTGLNNVALLGAGSGFVSFGSVCQDGDTFDYAITSEAGGQWESGIGTYIAVNNSFLRTTVTASSNNNEKVDFEPGFKQVFISVNSNTFSELDKTISKAKVTALAVAFGL